MTEDQQFKTTDFSLDEDASLHAQAAENVEDIEEVENPITPLADEVNIIGGNVNYVKFFNDLLLEICHIEHGFHDIQKSFTEALLRRGININPQTAYQHLELTLSRMMKILAAKRMVAAFGLQSEYDEILGREMNLIYGSHTANRLPKPTPAPIVGEVFRGGE